MTAFNFLEKKMLKKKLTELYVLNTFSELFEKKTLKTLTQRLYS